MRSSKRTSALLLLMLAFLLASCTPKNVILEVPEGIQQKIAEANQSVCSYKGRVSVIYTNEHEDIRFRGYLDKDCKDNFRLKILGLFNSVAYDVSYVSGKVQAYKKDKDVSSEMAYFMRSKGLDTMVSLIRYPHVKVDGTFKVKAVADEYILSKGVVTAAAGEDLLLRRISFGPELFTYSYDEGKLSGLTYTADETKVEIKLR